MLPQWVSQCPGAADPVFVGDNRADILAGRTAEVATIGAAWGFTPPEQLPDAGADLVLDDLGPLWGGDMSPAHRGRTKPRLSAQPPPVSSTRESSPSTRTGRRRNTK
ncbi:HAD family hydrolase [Streptomyces cyaneofuscatus]